MTYVNSGFVAERHIGSENELLKVRQSLGLGFRVFVWVFDEKRFDAYGNQIEMVEYLNSYRSFFYTRATPAAQVLAFQWDRTRKFYFVRTVN